VASLLGQVDVAASTRAATGLVIVNLFGGFLASVACALLTLRPSLFSMFLILLVVGLLLRGRAAARSNDARHSLRPVPCCQRPPLLTTKARGKDSGGSAESATLDANVVDTRHLINIKFSSNGLWIFGD
jgi:hypothetical protein